jgi:multidrug resistance efflux pump
MQRFAGKAAIFVNQAKANLAAVVASLELGKSKDSVAEAAVRSPEAQAKNSDTTLTRAAILAKDRVGTQAALDDAQAAGVKAHSEVDQATADLAYLNQQLVVIDANVGVAKAQVGSAEAALLSAKFALADTAVWAPIDGSSPTARRASANTSPPAQACSRSSRLTISG